MKGINKVILIGNLGQDPELKYTQGQQAILRLRLATNEQYKASNGEWQDRTEWHSVTVWGKRAEALSKFLRKGAALYVEGRLATRSWDDRDGNKRSTTEIVANEVIALSGGTREHASGERRGSGGAGRNPDAEDDGPPLFGGQGGSAKDNLDDDIPF